MLSSLPVPKYHLIALLVLAGACSDHPVDMVTGPTQTPVLMPASDPIDSLGQALAVALSDERFRLQLLADMRDSPFPRHSLHVPSYLLGTRGAPLLAAIAEALGRDVAGYAETLEALSGVAVFLNPMSFRATWRGEADVAVIPVYEGALNEGLIRGFMPGGSEIIVEYFGQSAFPVLVLGVTEIDFGDQPEAVRSSAPRRAGSTISTTEELYGLGDRAMPGTPPCGEGAGEGPQCADGQATFVSGTGSCFPVTAGPSGDADYDTVLDSCEAALAYAAAPFIAFDFGESDFSREPYWAATVIPTGRIRIFYALSYHRDWGYPWVPGNDHYGDSEFITVDLTPHGSGVWSVYQLFLSAHYNAGPAESSEWVLRSQFPAPVLAKDPSRPLGMEVWVARDKHANYKSHAACNSGNTTLDYCGTDVIASYVEAFANANLGQDGHRLINCTQSRPFSPKFWWAYVGTECFWSGSRFKGWYDPSVVGGDDSSPYGPTLRAFLPGPSLPPPPPPTNLQVTLSGPETAVEHAEEQCVWEAVTSGGQGSKTYELYYDSQPVYPNPWVGDNVWYGDTGSEGEHHLLVVVRDSSGAATDEMNVTVDNQWPECGW